MAITQKSKIQVRSGLQQNIPILDVGEMAYAVDSQRLFIGTGSVSAGAPYLGNTEIATVPNISSNTLVPLSGIPAGTIDGVNKTFTLPAIPLAHTLIVWKNTPLIPNIGYSLYGATIVFSVAPIIGDNIYYQCFVQ